MYFLTNKENVIIAISNDLLEKMGIDDICLVSKAIQNNLVKIDESKNEISLISNNENYKYNSSKIVSVLGDLTLYNIETEKTLNNLNGLNGNIDNIENLIETKEKDKTITDNSLDIPIIDELDKNIIQEESLEKSLNEDIKNDILEITPTKSEEKEQLEETTLLKPEPLDITNELDIKDDEILPLKTEELKIPKIPKEAIEEESLEVPKIVEDTKETLEEIKLEDSKEENLLLEESEPLKVDNLSEEIEKDILMDDALKIETEKNKEQNENKEKFIKIDELNYDKSDENEIAHIIEESEESKNKKSLFSKSIFPWKKRKDEDEIEQITDIEESLENKVDIVDNSLELEANKKEIIDTELPLKEDNKNEENLLLTENEVKNIKEEPINDKFSKLEEELLKDEEEELKENEVHKPSTTVTNDITFDKTTEREEKSKENENIVEKIIKIQIDNINLKENAQKLNLDIDSYKILIKSYIDEIKSYIPQLEEGDKDIISMLSDAGQLLSLNSIILKLKKLTNNKSENSAIINEIKIFTDLLENKLKSNENNESKNELETKKDSIEEQIESNNLNKETQKDKEEIEENQKSVDYIIDLDNAQTLLNEIKADEIELNFNKTAKELNLPKELIEEFTKDFFKQAKEHLEILIDAYKNKDLEKIQTTAHMLKGAANNLRLTHIGENLLKIQKESNIENIPDLIKKFAAQIKGLDKALKSIGE